MSSAVWDGVAPVNPATPVARVSIRPAGPRATVGFVLVLGGFAINVVLATWLLVSDSRPLLLYLVLLGPALIYTTAMAVLIGKVAWGVTLDRRGIVNAARRSRLIPWETIGGLRWGRTRWWGRRNHQLIADLRTGESVIVWGLKTPRQHDRLVAGLRTAELAGLIPWSVTRPGDLYQPWFVVSGNLDQRQPAPRR